MKQTINCYQFEQAFITMGRENNFSYVGRKALFDYLEEYEDSTGEEIELDVVALCCEYTEYANVKEFADAYSDDYIVWEIEPDEEENEPGEIDYAATLEKIGEHTHTSY